MVELRSGDVKTADKKQGTTVVPASCDGTVTPIPRHQGGWRSGNSPRARAGVASLQRAAAAVCCVLATLALGPGTSPAAAMGPAFADADAHLDGASPPGPAQTLAAFAVVESYIRGTGDLAALRSPPAPAVAPASAPTAAPLPTVTGCSVVLRLAGEVMGRGSSLGSPGTAPNTVHIAEAAEAAWAEAERKLPVSGVPAVRAEKIKLVRQDLLISLELAGPLLRMAVTTYADCDGMGVLQPGMDGVAVVLSGQVGSTFPGAATAATLLPSDAVRRAVSTAASAARANAGDAASFVVLEPGELEKKHGASFYRFRTTHVAQWRSDNSPQLLYRGQKIVVQEDVDEISELRYLADRLAGNLINRLTVTPKGGPLTLTTGDVDEPDAFSLALARHALLEYVARQDGPLKERAAAAAQEYLTLARERETRATDADHLAAASVILKNYDMKTAPEFAWRDQYLAGGKTETPAGLKGLVIWGGSAWPREVSGDPSTYHPSEKAVRALMAETPIPALAGEMPWLGWTDLEVDRWLKRPAGQKSAPALREMRTLVWKHQLQSVDAGPDRQDMVGGIVVPGGSGKAPLPTWQTARLVAFLATMLGEPELTTKQERPGEIVRLLGAARFLRQLQVDDSMGWMCKDPATAKGGLRSATWEQRTPTDATAMGLLALLEIINGLERASVP